MVLAWGMVMAMVLAAQPTCSAASTASRSSAPASAGASSASSTRRGSATAWHAPAARQRARRSLPAGRQASLLQNGPSPSASGNAAHAMGKQLGSARACRSGLQHVIAPG